jgi:hypothetical protein
MIAQLIVQVQQQRATEGPDPVIELIGAYRSDQSLIGGIPVSEDPALYAAPEFLAARVERMHAWDIAPARCAQGEDGRSIRRASDE